MAYDELFDGPVIRSLYRKSYQKYSQRSLAEKNQAQKAARRCVHRDAEFLPLVRLLTDREYAGLIAGVRQRGRALHLFLHDHCFGGRTYERSGILTAAQVEKIKSSYAVVMDPSALRPENIQFWYSPDIIRDEDGQFQLVEDNIGLVGGFGDLEAFADAARALGTSITSASHPRSFYRGMINSYRRQARRYGKGKTILLSYPKSQRRNHEDERLSNVFENLGVPTVTNLRTLKIQAAGLFHGEERVGFVIINRKLEDIDQSSHRISQFWQAVSKGQLGVSYSPGLDFIDDKRFCASVDSLIQFYLDEDCLLPSLATLFLEAEGTIEKVSRQREEWVIKRGKGQSGDSVWVGKHLSDIAWARLFTRIKKHPGEYIAQKYCEPSRLLGHAVDLRPLAVVSPAEVQVSPMPWGRAAKNAKGKTNIACGGLLAPVAIIPDSD